MGHIGEFPSTIRLFLQAYRWRRINPVPWQPLAKPLSECRVALVTSAGLVEPDQEPFDTVRSGVATIASGCCLGMSTRKCLIESHRSRSFARAGIEADKEIAFPIERLRALADAGRIGSVSPTPSVVHGIDHRAGASGEAQRTRGGEAPGGG